MSIPDWLLAKISPKGNLGEIPGILKQAGLHTVCQEARCPNIGECFARGTATFLILGDVCTRNCRFCGIKKASLAFLPVDPEEPERLARLVTRLPLKHVVITSVTRDDLPDGGAEQFARSIREIRKEVPGISIEVLIPDFAGNLDSFWTVVKEKPEVINHNLETIKRLYPEVRPQGDYKRSLSLIRKVKKMNSEIFTKSGLMLGLGEENDEVISAFHDLRAARCEMITVGQYFQPTGRQIPVSRYLSQEEFNFFKRKAEELGFLFVASDSFVRSSYRAKEAYEKASLNNVNRIS